jgi:hypothetical protein
VQPLQQAIEEIERGGDGKVDAEGRADAYLCFEYLRGV